jgi:hypothetical protein
MSEMKTMTVGSSIEVRESGVRVQDLDIPRRGVAAYLDGLPEADRELAFIEAVEVGVFCLERASGARDLDFVRRQVDGLLVSVQQAVSSIPHTLEDELVKKLGTGDGQVLAPVQRSVEGVSRTLTERVGEVRELLSEKIDPDKRSSVLGRALSRIGDLLDPARGDSVQAILTKAVEGVSGRDGNLAKCVRETVSEAVKPLADEVNRLAKQMAAGEAADEAILGTTLKGHSFEEEVVAELQRWAAGTGAAIQHVGGDNQPGDILVEFPADAVVQPAQPLVVEVRDRATRAGRKVVSAAMDGAMTERSAGTGIYLSRSRDGLALEIGDWAEGAAERGPWVATTHENLFIALRFLIVQQRLAILREAAAEVDREGIRAQIERVRTSLRRITTINRAAGEIRSQAGTVEDEAELIRREIRDALGQAEEALRASSADNLAA